MKDGEDLLNGREKYALPPNFMTQDDAFAYFA